MARAAMRDERLSDGALYGKLADEIERLGNSLWKLSNEVLALKAFEGHIREAIGHTNYRILIDRAEDGRRKGGIAMAKMSFDPKCRDLAEHFYTAEMVTASTLAGEAEQVDSLAQYIQDAVEDWFRSGRPVLPKDGMKP